VKIVENGETLWQRLVLSGSICAVKSTVDDGLRRTIREPVGRVGRLACGAITSGAFFIIISLLFPSLWGGGKGGWGGEIKETLAIEEMVN